MNNRSIKGVSQPDFIYLLTEDSLLMSCKGDDNNDDTEKKIMKSTTNQHLLLQENRLNNVRYKIQRWIFFQH